MAVLRTVDLSVRYGGVRALVDLNLEVHEGQIVGLIGTNGAGKTTALDALTGFAPASGHAYLDDVEILNLPAHSRARLGLARTWQAGQLFEDMTTRENLRVAESSLGSRRLTRGFRRDGRMPEEKQLADVLTLLGLEEWMDTVASDLSQGQRKLVGLARALKTSPKVLLADEPAAGLDTNESSTLGGHFRRLAQAGLGILLVEHDMSLVMNACDYIVVLDQGFRIAHGSPEAVKNDERVRAAYLGAQGGGTTPTVPETEVTRS